MAVFEEERALPPIWKGSVKDTSRFDWYTRLVVNSGLVKGGKAVIPELIAAMCAESSLDNLAIGNNAKNGANNPSLGIGWMQLDTAYHVESIGQMHFYRQDPLSSLVYVCDPANGLCSQGGVHTHFAKTAWHAWKQKIIDPQEGWNMLKEAEAAYDRVTT